MLRSDKNDIQSLIDYIKDIKPFHTKLTDVLVEYQHHDTVRVGVTDSHRIRARLSSTWDYNYISNGVVNRFRLPAVCLPRYSIDGGAHHLWTFKGVVDAIPQYPSAYRVPYNNGMEVSVNGVKYTEGVEYVLTDPTHDAIYFNDPFVPVVGDIIEANLINLDRLFINVNGTWAMFKIQGYIEPTERYNPYNDALDSASWGVFIFGEDPFDNGPGGYKLDKDQAYLHNGGVLFPGFQTNKPIGHIRVLTDSNGGEYYTFVFDEWIFTHFVKRETKVHFRVEQAETYNNITRTVFTESLKVSDLFKYRDDITVTVGENLPKNLGFEAPDWDSVGFDLDQTYDPWIAIKEVLSDTVGVGVADAYRDRYLERYKDAVSLGLTDSNYFMIRTASSDLLPPIIIENQSNGFDLLPFDSMPFDYQPEFIRFIANDDEQLGAVATTSIVDSVSFEITDH